MEQKQKEGEFKDWLAHTNTTNQWQRVWAMPI